MIIAVVLIFLILLHSGKDAGLSGAFGIGGGGSSFGGGSMVERNLDRELRGEAIAILKKLDRLRPPKPRDDG